MLRGRPLASGEIDTNVKRKIERSFVAKTKRTHHKSTVCTSAVMISLIMYHAANNRLSNDTTFAFFGRELGHHILAPQFSACFWLYLLLGASVIVVRCWCSPEKPKAVIDHARNGSQRSLPPGTMQSRAPPFFRSGFFCPEVCMGPCLVIGCITRKCLVPTGRFFLAAPCRCCWPHTATTQIAGS